MGKPKGTPRTPGSGRSRGTPNRVTAQLREMTLEALERLGGVDYLEWLGENEPAYRAWLEAQRLDPGDPTVKRYLADLTRAGSR